MLDGLLGRGFSSKCKSLIKATRTRIGVVRRRAEAKQKFLKEDLAKLLSNGLDINAYGRTEEFLAGLSLLSSYDFIEESCEYVVKQLSKMQKSGECPEECREAVSSLMFAAARFSDLPELRDLRDTFLERYGNSLEFFVNQKFIEKFSSRSPTTENRLQVLQDIASEFSIMWNYKGFEKRMAAPAPAPAPAQVTISERNILKQRPGLLDDGKQICNRQEGNAVKRNELNHAAGREKTSYYKQKSLVKGEDSTSSGGHSVLFHGKQGLMEDKHLNLKGKDDISLKGVTKSSPSPRHTVDNIVGGLIRHNNGVHTRKGETIEALSWEKPDVSTRCTGFPGKSEDLISSPDHVNRKNILNSTGKAPVEETDRLKSCYSNLPPPPYIKSKDNAILPLPPYTKPKEDKHRAGRGSKYGGSDFDGHFIGSSPHNRSKQGNSLGKSHEEPDHHDHEGKSLELVKIDSYGYKKEDERQDNAIPFPKRSSTRKKHQKLSSNHDSVGNVDDFSSAKRSSSSRRRDHSKKGLQILFDNEHHQNDEEERVIDKLLIHYSKKPSSYDAGKVKKKLLAHSSHQRAIQRAIDAGELSLDQRRDERDVESEIIPHPARSISLPHTESGSPQVKKVFTRANTFQPDNQARHVHPKLPDYDDLAARFGALKGQ